MFHVKQRPDGDFVVSRETWGRLEVLEALVRRWSRTINLVSKGDLAALRERHIEDSLQLAAYIPPDAETAIDIGSGAGFPGLVLALATGVRFQLVEADARKSAFLREAIRVTGANATVHPLRIESAALAAADVVTARGFADLDQLLEVAHPHLTESGVCLFPKGRAFEDELTRASAKWQMRVERHPSRTDPSSTILRLSEIRPVPTR